MVTNEFLEAFADFYGDHTLDELADRLGVSSYELAAFAEDLIDDNFDDISEEMEYNSETDEEDDG